MVKFEIDRKFSNGSDWDNSIDCDDASDGSVGGYDRHGNFIIANAMMELIKLRVENDALRAERSAARKECDRLRKFFALAAHELPRLRREALYDMIAKGSLE